jgi:hypothetical protein
MIIKAGIRLCKMQLPAVCFEKGCEATGLFSHPYGYDLILLGWCTGNASPLSIAATCTLGHAILLRAWSISYISSCDVDLLELGNKLAFECVRLVSVELKLNRDSPGAVSTGSEYFTIQLSEPPKSDKHTISVPNYVVQNNKPFETHLELNLALGVPFPSVVDEIVVAMIKECRAVLIPFQEELKTA